MEPDEKERFLDEWLDQALTQYGQVEPRPGLENRVLAAVRVERERGTTHGWRWQAALAGLAAILLIAGGMHFVRWESGHVQPPLAKVNPAPSEQQGLRPSQAKTAKVEEAANGKFHVRVPRSHSRPVIESVPVRADQFPSPEPLSEQEKMLARYVQQFPREADFMAQAQTRLMQQEMSENSTPAGDEISDSEQQNQ